MVQTSHKACIPRTYATRWWMGKMVTELEWQQKQRAKRAERQVKRKGFGRTSQPFPPTILLLPPCHPVRPKPMATPERASDSANQHCRRLCTRTSSRCRSLTGSEAHQPEARTPWWYRKIQKSLREEKRRAVPIFQTGMQGPPHQGAKTF